MSTVFCGSSEKEHGRISAGIWPYKMLTCVLMLDTVRLTTLRVVFINPGIIAA